MQVAGGAIHRLGYPGVKFFRRVRGQVRGVGHGAVCAVLKGSRRSSPEKLNPARRLLSLAGMSSTLPDRCLVNSRRILEAGGLRRPRQLPDLGRSRVPARDGALMLEDQFISRGVVDVRLPAGEWRAREKRVIADELVAERFAVHGIERDRRILDFIQRSRKLAVVSGSVKPNGFDATERRDSPVFFCGPRTSSACSEESTVRGQWQGLRIVHHFPLSCFRLGPGRLHFLVRKALAFDGLVKLAVPLSQRDQDRNLHMRHGVHQFLRPALVEQLLLSRFVPSCDATASPRIASA